MMVGRQQQHDSTHGPLAYLSLQQDTTIHSISPQSLELLLYNNRKYRDPSTLSSLSKRPHKQGTSLLRNITHIHIKVQ